MPLMKDIDCNVSITSLATIGKLIYKYVKVGCGSEFIGDCAKTLVDETDKMEREEREALKSL